LFVFCYFVRSAWHSDLCNMKQLLELEALLLQPIIAGYSDYFLTFKTYFSSKIISSSLILNYLHIFRGSVWNNTVHGLERLFKWVRLLWQWIGLLLSPETGFLLAYSGLIRILQVCCKLVCLEMWETYKGLTAVSLILRINCSSCEHLLPLMPSVVQRQISNICFPGLHYNANMHLP
jgi:hypothetical protein